MFNIYKKSQVHELKFCAVMFKTSTLHKPTNDSFTETKANC